jgi:hypothetical protein
VVRQNLHALRLSHRAHNVSATRHQNEGALRKRAAALRSTR